MRRFLTIAGLLVALPLGAAPALAFQETPVPPAADVKEAPRATKSPSTLPPAMQLGTPADAAQPEEESGGLFGFGLLPKLNPFSKLNFGLDVLYGNKQQQLELQQQGSKADENGDISVVGKVKRRF